MTYFKIFQYCQCEQGCGKKWTLIHVSTYDVWFNHHLEQYGFFSKQNNIPLIWFSNTISWYLHLNTKTLIIKDICTPMLSVACSTIANIWKISNTQLWMNGLRDSGINTAATQYLWLLVLEPTPPRRAWRSHINEGELAPPTNGRARNESIHYLGCTLFPSQWTL